MACDPYWNETVALLNFNGTDGDTTTTDGTGLNTWTFAGNAHIEDTESKFGGTSLQLDGTGDYVYTADSARSDFGTGDFTLEAFIRITGVSGVSDTGTLAKHMAIISTNPASTGWCFYVRGDTSDSNLGLGIETKLSGVASNTSVLHTLTLNTWYHVAVCREAGEVRIFVDGVRIHTATITADISGGTTGMQVGTTGLTGYYRYFNGYIDGVRVTKGICRYNADFTNPATEFEACLLLEEDIAEVGSLAELFAPTTYTAIGHDEVATCADLFTNETFTFMVERAIATAVMSSGSNTTATLAETAVGRDIIQQVINQIVAESANAVDAQSIGLTSLLAEIASASTVLAPSFNAVMMVAEFVTAVEFYNNVTGEDIAESGLVSDAYVARVGAVYQMIEQAQALDENTGVLHTIQLVSESAAATDVVSSEGSIFNYMMSEGAIALVRLNIGGELFTGWVLNTKTLASSEYQFADLEFNSACKHGDRYLMAAEDGIYEFTEDADVETVMTYIKTGKMDFGSDKRKRVVNSYMVYSAKGQMQLKVTISENGQLQTYTYQMQPFAADDTPDVRRFDIGKGLKSRYWQFEIVGEGADPIFDEIGMLPVVLSRRI